MTKHVKTFMDYHGYGAFDFIPCGICRSAAVDIHHIVYRSRAHKDYKDHISNLIPLCRVCHDKAHNEIYDSKYLLQIIHKKLKLKDRLTENEIRYGKMDN